MPLPVYEKIVQRIMLMRYSQNDYHYNCLGVLLCKLGLAHQRQHHYFCSQFVADVLQRSGALEFSEAIQTAKDLARLEGLMCGISSGTNVAAARKLAKKLGEVPPAPVFPARCDDGAPWDWLHFQIAAAHKP